MINSFLRKLFDCLLALAVFGLERILSLLEWQEQSTKVGGYWLG